MINFNELRVTDKCLIIDVSVKNLQYYNDVYIDAIIIDTQDTYMANGPSTNPIFSYEVSSNPNIVYSLPECDGCGPIRDEEDGEICLTGVGSDGEKRIRLELDTKTLGVPLNDTLFFVYAIAKGTPAPDTPCGMDNQTTMGVVANLYPFYRSMMCYMKETLDRCDIPKNFLDKYLRFKAFELSLKTCHYTEAINMWNKFFRNINNPCQTNKTPCGCHG